jgi:hypothetical protein
MKNTRRGLIRAGAVAAAALAMLLGSTSAAFAATETVCNAAFCNATSGSGTTITQIKATKIGQNQNVIGFFEAFGPGGVQQTGPTTSANTTIFSVSGTVPKGKLVCVRFFAKNSGGGFVEVGTAQCTKSPF